MIKKRQLFRHMLGGGSTRMESQHKGGIEQIMPGRITGWVFSETNPLYEVRLLAGSCLIARSEINQLRQDVIDKYGHSGNCGYLLQLPTVLPSLDWSKPARLLALNADGSHQVELQLFNNREHTREHLKNVLQSDVLGLDGHFDGIVQGAIQGWAARKNQQDSAKIWLQCEGHEPIQIVCDQIREGITAFDLPSNCGFRMMLEDIPTSWRGSSLTCSFDRIGAFNLPQNQPVFVPLDAQTEVINSLHASQRELILSKVKSAPNELEHHWKDLLMFSVILDDIEKNLDLRADASKLPIQDSRSKSNWIKKLLRIS